MRRAGPPLARRGSGRLVCLALAALIGGGCDGSHRPPEQRVAGADPERGRMAIARTGCGACHAIPGLRGARGTVGPPLDGFARRNFIGGTLPNQPSVLIDWVRLAPEMAPGTAMPRLPLSEAEARDVAAYLYTLD